MYAPRSLLIHPFGQDPLSQLRQQHPLDKQPSFLTRYLDDLQAKSVLEEPYYFDRDYLSEFSAFYSLSSAGYPNVCRRLNFFSLPLTDQLLSDALGGNATALHSLQTAYLGFVVYRPIPASPIGRTVLRWYPESNPANPRVTTPFREYHVHVAGLELKVEGLAWQQQDSAVGACATIALWSMLHSSAFDGYHAMPTTAAITRAAHRTASLGERVFPSTGLAVFQLREAIKEYGLAPAMLAGDMTDTNGERCFSPERFCNSLSVLLRSGYPAILEVDVEENGHAVCAVGFRPSAPPVVAQGASTHRDAEATHVYIHDDNIGPNVRFRIVTTPDGYVQLKTESPTLAQTSAIPDLAANYPELTPRSLIAAVPEDLRTSPDKLNEAGLDLGAQLSATLAAVMQQVGQTIAGTIVSTRFVRLHDYLRLELPKLLAGNAVVLSRVRRDLVEKVRPMSQHLGVIRIMSGQATLIEILYDTTDSDRNHAAFTHLLFQLNMAPIVHSMCQTQGIDLGVKIDAY